MFAYQAGHMHGLILTLFMDVDEYYLHLADSVGALVAVHSPYFSSYDLDKSSIFVAPGTSVSMALSVQNITRLDKPYNSGARCIHDRRYSQKACLKQCLAQKMNNECDCVPIKFIREANKINGSICDPFNITENDCLSRSRDGLSNEDCTCYPACLQINFLQTVSSSVWPSKTQMPSVLEMLNMTGKRAAEVVKNLEKARDNMALVNIYYDSMTVTHIKQTPAMTWTTLLGDVGGQLGLFIGCSLITLVEFFGLFLRLIKPTKTSNDVASFNLSRDKDNTGHSAWQDSIVEAN
ncbi:degenerin del-1-like [Montipora capricornis]|uniref:degenerin del-1-like n=1 Tax=Montipora capricornis TaxID=246305 RepID=UPI0035F15C13